VEFWKIPLLKESARGHSQARLNLEKRNPLLNRSSRKGSSFCFACLSILFFLMCEPFPCAFSSSMEQNYYHISFSSIRTKILLRSLVGTLYFFSSFSIFIIQFTFMSIHALALFHQRKKKKMPLAHFLCTSNDQLKVVTDCINSLVEMCIMPDQLVSSSA
jgi:hypothetical protein